MALNTFIKFKSMKIIFSVALIAVVADIVTSKKQNSAENSNSFQFTQSANKNGQANSYSIDVSNENGRIIIDQILTIDKKVTAQKVEAELKRSLNSDENKKWKVTINGKWNNCDGLNFKSII